MASTTPPPSADPVPKDGWAPALHRNRRKSSATLGCSSCSHLQKWNSPPTPTANLSSQHSQETPPPFRSAGGWKTGTGLGTRTWALSLAKPLPCQACCSSLPPPGPACLPAASSREPFLTPHHQARHPAFWTSSPGRARFCLGDPAGAGSLPFCQPLCASQR